MSKELIVRSKNAAMDFALLEDGELVELHKQEETSAFCVGDILLARVRKPMKGLNAAFVDVGYEKDGFLHYNDLGRNVKTVLSYTKSVVNGQTKNFALDNVKITNAKEEEQEDISKILSSNLPIIVQISKEPISTKGPRVSAEISLAGRYLVLVPFSDKVSVSQKIEDKQERNRLVRLIESIKPKGFGVIIRTVARDKKVADLDSDLKDLFDKWDKMCQKLSKSKPVTTVLREGNKASTIIRDMFNEEFTGIHINDERLYAQIKEDISKIDESKESIVKYYESTTPIFEKYGIERQIKSTFGKVVTMSKGGYLVIEHTEALHVVDVNSGARSNKLKSQQDTALEVNLIAAKEIARQLRLRDMGGIVVVDFIDMDTAEYRKELYDYLRECMRKDKARHKILPPSKFGLIQITRQRVRPERKIETEEKDPGTGEITTAPILTINKLSFEIEDLISNKLDSKGLILNIHPFIASYLTKGVFSIRFKWFLKFKKWIKIIPRDAYSYLEYSFKDKEGNLIE